MSWTRNFALSFSLKPEKHIKIPGSLYNYIHIQTPKTASKLQLANLINKIRQKIYIGMQYHKLISQQIGKFMVWPKPDLPHLLLRLWADMKDGLNDFHRYFRNGTSYQNTLLAYITTSNN